jgi:hypothetical protein
MFRAMHMWLADQAQSSVPAWLTSPWVALLGLVSSVIAVLQALIASTKWFAKRTDKASTRQRLAVSLAVCVFACIVVLAPLTWEMMAVEDTKAGSNPLWIAEMYPVCVFSPLLICIIFFLQAGDGRRNWRSGAAIVAFILTLGLLAFPAGLYDSQHSSFWEQCLVSATPTLAIAMRVITYLAHLIHKSEPSAGDNAKLSVSTENVHERGP